MEPQPKPQPKKSLFGGLAKFARSATQEIMKEDSTNSLTRAVSTAVSYAGTDEGQSNLGGLQRVATTAAKSKYGRQATTQLSQFAEGITSQDSEVRAKTVDVAINRATTAVAPLADVGKAVSTAREGKYFEALRLLTAGPSVTVELHLDIDVVCSCIEALRLENACLPKLDLDPVRGNMTDFKDLFLNRLLPVVGQRGLQGLATFLEQRVASAISPEEKELSKAAGNLVNGVAKGIVPDVVRSLSCRAVKRCHDKAPLLASQALTSLKEEEVKQFGVQLAASIHSARLRHLDENETQIFLQPLTAQCHLSGKDPWTWQLVCGMIFGVMVALCYVGVIGRLVLCTLLVNNVRTSFARNILNSTRLSCCRIQEEMPSFLRAPKSRSLEKVAALSKSASGRSYKGITVIELAGPELEALAAEIGNLTRFHFRHRFMWLVATIITTLVLRVTLLLRLAYAFLIGALVALILTVTSVRRPLLKKNIMATVAHFKAGVGLVLEKSLPDGFSALVTGGIFEKVDGFESFMLGMLLDQRFLFGIPGLGFLRSLPGGVNELRFSTILHVPARGLRVNLPSDKNPELHPNEETGGCCLSIGTEKLQFDSDGKLMCDAWIPSADGRERLVGLRAGMHLVAAINKEHKKRKWEQAKKSNIEVSALQFKERTLLGVPGKVIPAKYDVPVFDFALLLNITPSSRTLSIVLPNGAFHAQLEALGDAIKDGHLLEWLQTYLGNYLDVDILRELSLTHVDPRLFWGDASKATVELAGKIRLEYKE